MNLTPEQIKIKKIENYIEKWFKPEHRHLETLSLDQNEWHEGWCSGRADALFDNKQILEM